MSLSGINPIYNSIFGKFIDKVKFLMTLTKMAIKISWENYN